MPCSTGRSGGEWSGVRSTRNVNIMAWLTAPTRRAFLKACCWQAIDRHLVEAGIAPTYNNAFWGGRSEIAQREISPVRPSNSRRMELDPDVPWSQRTSRIQAFLPDQARRNAAWSFAIIVAQRRLGIVPPYF